MTSYFRSLWSQQPEKEQESEETIQKPAKNQQSSPLKNTDSPVIEKKDHQTFLKKQNEAEEEKDMAQSNNPQSLSTQPSSNNQTEMDQKQEGKEKMNSFDFGQKPNPYNEQFNTQEQHPIERITNLPPNNEEQSIIQSHELEKQRTVAQEEEIKEQHHESSNDNTDSMADLTIQYKKAQQMPSCVEKYLYELLYFVQIILLRKPDTNIDEAKQEFSKSLDGLSHSLKQEERETIEIDSLMKKLKIFYKTEEFLNAKKFLNDIKRKINKLNLLELFEFINCVNGGAEIIKDRDVILIVGSTGSGKSTTIHYLCGSEMGKLIVGELEHIGPINIKIPSARNVKCSPQMVSETLYITPVPMNLKDIGYRKSKDIILCDSPGFEDSRGPEIDIANGYGIVHAIRQCKSVRVVMLMSQKNISDRMPDVKKLSEILVGMIPNMSKYGKTFSYLFSKCPENDRKQVQPRLKELFNSLQDEPDFQEGSPFYSLVDNMIKKTKIPKFVDPLDGQPIDILEDIIDSDAIERPAEAFQFFISPESKSSIQEQIRIHQLVINSSLKHGNYDLIKYKLDELKQLDFYLNQDNIKSVYNEIIKNVQFYVQSEYENVIAVLNKCFDNKNSLNEEDIGIYIYKYQKYQSLEDLKRNHLKDDLISSESFLLNIQNQARVMITTLSSINIFDHLSLARLLLDKLKLLQKYFPIIELQYKEALQTVQNSMNELKDVFQQQIKVNNFEKQSHILQHLSFLNHTLVDHFDQHNLDNQLSILKSLVITHLEEISTELSRFIFRGSLKQSETRQFNDFILVLESSILAYKITPTIEIHLITNIRDYFKNVIIIYFNRIIEEIESSLKTAKENGLSETQKLVEQITLIKEIESLEGQTSEAYFSIIGILCSFVEELKRDTETIIEKLDKRETSIDFERLQQCLISLQGAEWMEYIRAGVYSDIMKGIQKKVTKYCLDLYENIKQYDLDYTNYHQIEEISHKITQLYQMKAIQSTFSNIESKIKEIHEWFNESLNFNFSIIDNFTIEKVKQREHEDIDLSKVEIILSYLKACKSVKILPQNQISLKLNTFEEFIALYGTTMIQSQINKNLQKIMANEAADKDKIESLVSNIHLRFTELLEIKMKHPQIQNLIDRENNLIEKYTRKLYNCLNEISENIKNLQVTHNHEMLMNKLDITKQMSQLDEFLSHQKFIDVYKTYQDLLFNDIPNLRRDTIEAIQRYDFATVLSDLVNLELNHVVFEQFKTTLTKVLNDSIEMLLEETVSKTRNTMTQISRTIDFDKVESIAKNLKCIQNSKLVDKYFNSELAQKINDCFTKTKATIQKNILEMINLINGLMSNNNFFDAEEKISNILLICEILEFYCENSIKEKVYSLREELEQSLKKLVKKYQDEPIYNVRMNAPKEIFKKLEQNNNNLSYINSIKEIEIILIQKFTDELKEITSKSSSQYQKNKEMSRLESLMKYLPKQIKDIIEQDIQDIKEEIQDQRESLTQTITSYIANKQLQNIVEFYQDNKNTDISANLTKMIREFIRSEMQTLKSNCIITSGDKKNLEEIFPYLLEMHELKTMFIKIFPAEISQTFSDTQNSISKRIKQDIINVSKYFDCDLETMINVSKINEAAIRIELNNSFESMIDDDYDFETSSMQSTFYNPVDFSFSSIQQLIKQRVSTQEIIKDIFPQLDESLSVLLNKIAKNISDHQTRFDKSIKDSNINSIKNILKNMNKWNKYIMEFKHDLDQYEGLGISIEIFITILKEGKFFNEMVRIVSLKLAEIKEYILKEDFINDKTKEVKKDREEYYKIYNAKVQAMKKARLLKKYMQNQNIVDVNKIEDECMKIIGDKIEAIAERASEILHREKMSRKDCKEFAQNYDNLNAITNNLEIKTDQYKKCIVLLKDDMTIKIQEIQRAVVAETKIENIAEYFIELQNLTENILDFQQEIDDNIEITLKKVKEAKGATVISKIGALLDKNEVGKSILTEHKIFEGFIMCVFNNKTQKHGIDFVLKNLEGNDLDKEILMNRYNEYYTKYQKLLDQYLSPKGFEVAEFLAEFKAFVGKPNVKLPFKYNEKISIKIPKIISYIFALYTLQNTTHYYEASDSENKDENNLFQPHPAQIVSILRILCIGDKEEVLKNNLVQIGTGEGKSITLGVTSIILTLLGFEVCCACYSEYLSKRDYDAFLNLFELIGVTNFIKYGTFNKLCEYIINSQGDIREKVKNSIFNKVDKAKTIKEMGRPKILLVDEVDVFFGKDFYGNKYIPATTLKDPLIKELVDFIWQNKKEKLDLVKVKESSQYKACSALFKGWERLVEESVKNMLFDLQGFESHGYEVCQDKIGYIDQDQISFNSSYGYQTMFAYYKENENGKITKESLDNNVKFLINSGNFSFAEIPQQFQFILGVTGTLKTLSQPEKEVVEKEYKILRNTYIPSVFGQNNRIFNQNSDTIIETQDDYYNGIIREVKNRLLGKNKEISRAVIVFFESTQELMAFYNSDQFRTLRTEKEILILTEKANAQEKQKIIKNATSQGQISLMTKSFGRGTDFILRDEVVASNGGIHVISTFLSHEISEEIQIQGRTARQGEQGSFSMIILDKSLEYFLIQTHEITEYKSLGKIYDLIHTKRSAKFKDQYENNKKFIEVTRTLHQASMCFLNDLLTGQDEKVYKYLVDQNLGPTPITTFCSKTIVCMDATGSMGGLIDKAKNTVGIMFERILKILQSNGMDGSSFQMQFCCFRNYPQKEPEILQSSSWEIRAENLRQFMEKIRASGGSGPGEAVEIGLWHANFEATKDKVSQVILIGDAPSNTLAEAKNHRVSNHGEAYWQKTKFGLPTGPIEECAKLKAKNIPVHAFYVNAYAEASYKQIAALTGGKSELLDVNSAKGADQLTNLVSEQVLLNIGQNSGKGNSMVEMYKKEYAKTYS